jgi:diaminopimelate decarboxylase
VVTPLHLMLETVAAGRDFLRGAAEPPASPVRVYCRASVSDLAEPGSDADAVFAGLDPASARALAVRFGTPVHLISERALVARARALRAAARRHGATIAWSMKTNPLLGVLALLRREGLWVEVVSDLEYALARESGVPGGEIVFNGPARSDAVLARALREGALLHVDHLDELDRVVALARELDGDHAIGLRVDPAGSGRFGLAPGRGELTEALRRIDGARRLRLGGLHLHAGGASLDLAHFRKQGDALADIARDSGRPLAWLDAGGGLAGANPRPADPVRRHAWPDASAWCDAVLAPLAGLAPRLLVEPGRTLVEPAGALLVRVVGRRTTPDRVEACVLEAGIDAVPTAHSWRHPVRALLPSPGAPRPTALYGPLCMRRDRIADAAPLPPLARGDLLLVEGTGAYDLPRAMSFSHLRPGVLLWRGGDDATWLRRPERIEDVLGRESIPG